MFGRLSIKYRKVLIGEKISKELVKKILLEKGAKSVEIKEEFIKFKSKSLVSYHNFHAFAYIEGGRISFSDISHGKIEIEYILYSYRIPLLSLFLLLFGLFLLQHVIFAVFFALLNYYLGYKLTYNKHKRLFDKIIRESIPKEVDLNNRPRSSD